MGAFNPGGLNKPPISIVNGFSAGGATAAAATSEWADSSGAVVTLSGALTATTYKEMLSVSGSGVLQFAGVQALDITERTMGIKVIIDGTTVFDASCAVNTTDNAFVVAVGNGYALGYDFAAMPFNSSLSIQIKSSLSETDKIQIAYAYYLT